MRNARLARPFLACIAVIGAVTAHASDTRQDNRLTIFGIGMMEPISIPECGTFADPVKFRKRYGTYPYAPPTSGPCYRRADRTKSGTNEPLAFENLDVQFPTTTSLQYAYGVTVLMLDGQVQGMSWFTRGQPEQALAFAALKIKFGEPASTNVEIKQNSFGAKYESITANWNLPNTLTLVFTGIDSKINQGKVSILTIAARTRVLNEMSKSDTGIKL